MRRWGRTTGASAAGVTGSMLVATAMILGGALPATAAVDDRYELVEVAAGSVYSVVGPPVEAGGVVYFQGTSPSAPGGSWLFAFDPATGAVGPVGATSSIGQVSGLRSDGAMLFFLSPAGGQNAVHVYDPASDSVGAYDWPAGENAFADQLAILGADVYIVMQSDGLLYSVPRTDPASAPGLAPAATSPLPKCVDGTTDPGGFADSLSSVGGFVYYEQSCADIASDQLFRRASPSAAEAVAFSGAADPAEFASAYAVLEHGGRTFFAAGAISGTQHEFSFVDLAAPPADLGGLNPGSATVFQGAVTWFMQDGAERPLLRSADGLTATPVGPLAAQVGMEAELGLTAWGDVLLLNGFPVVSPSDPVGTRTNYLYDASDTSFSRIGPAGAIVPPFVTSAGDAYVTAFAGMGADADSQHLYQVVRRALPDTGADPLTPALAAGLLLVLGGGLFALAARMRPCAQACLAIRRIVRQSRDMVAGDRDSAVLPGALHAALRTAILDGGLAPGTAVTESAVGLRHGVARPTARLAIERLVAEGLLHREPHQAARVPELDAHDVADIYEARAIVEQAAIERLARSGSIPAEALEAHRELLDLEAEAPFARVDARFHRGLVAGQSNARLARMHGLLMSEIELCIAQVQAERLLTPREIGAQHQAILDAVVAGDAVLAGRLAREHVHGARDRLLAALAPAKRPAPPASDAQTGTPAAR